MTALLVWPIFVIWNVCDNFFPVCSTISNCHQFILLFASHQFHDVIITLQFDLTLLLEARIVWISLNIRALLPLV